MAFKPQNKVQSDGTTKKGKLEVFLTGTFLSETSQEDLKLGEVDLGEFDFNKVNTFTKLKRDKLVIS